MKTIQKVVAVLGATLVSTFAFGQLNLGVQSATSAAVNAAVNTSSVVQVTQAVVHSTRGTVSTVVGKSMDLKTTASGTVNATADKTTETATKVRTGVKKRMEVRAGAEVNSGVRARSGQSQQQADANISAEVNSETKATVGGQ